MTTAIKKPAMKPIDVGAWEQLGTHTVTLPSGAVVKIRIPDLSVLLAGDAVPDSLRTIAFEQVRLAMKAQVRAQLGDKAGDETLDDLVEEQAPADNTEFGQRMSGLARLNRYLVTQTLVEPQITEAQLEKLELPSGDVMMLTEFASRRRDVDARGVRLGVEPIDRWELWRQAHACPDECEHCAEVIDTLSSIAR